MFSGISQNSFTSFFSSEEDCKAYLSQLKWNNGYECKHCGNKTAIRGRTAFHKRCSSCKYDESATAHTLFHKIKIPLSVAFGIIYKISIRKKGMSTLELSKEFCINQKTAWLFKRKSQEGMQFFVDPASKQSHKIHPKPNRKNKSKHTENVKGQNWKRIKNYQFKRELVCIYSKAKNCQVMLINSVHWLRGIHHICSKKFLRGYIMEFLYRYLNRHHIGVSFHLLVQTMIKHPPYMYRSKAL